MQWLRSNLLPMDFKGKSVLEVGSKDVNGSPRSVVAALKPRSYFGIDIEPGPGVDAVVSIHDLLALDASYDAIIATEVLEHVEDWRDAIHQLKATVKPGGVIVLTTRRPGFPRHCHPHDHWRFTRGNLAAAFQDFWVRQVEDLEGQGVAIIASKPYSWEQPCSLEGIHPRPAPTRDQRYWERRLWIAWAYRGRNPAA